MPGAVGLWRGAWILGAVGVLVGVAAGGPFLGHGWQMVWVIVGGAVIVGAVALVLEARAQTEEGSKLGWGVPALVALAVVVGVSGVVNTEVVAGKPVLSTSTEAKMLRFSTTTVERLYRLGEIDALLDLDQVQGRLRITEMENAYREVEKWSVEYERLRAEDLEVEELVAVEMVLEATVNQALATIDNQLRWLKTGDPVAQRVATEHRQAMSRGVLEAGLMLADVAEKYGLIITEVEGGLVE